MAIALTTLYRARHLNQIAEQQELFGDRGLARIRMRDDGKGATLCDRFSH